MLSTKVKRTIDQDHLLDYGDRVIVGVSGGLDSMVLLHLLTSLRQTYDLSLIVAHVNHRIRVNESEREAQFVRREALRLGLPFEYGEFEVKGFQEKEGLSLEDAARRVRFKFFNDLLEKYQAHKIALGHHADDQVETLLLRFLRGSGIRGLKGMLPIREGRVIRPLLDVWKDEIESFARERGISYVIDSSNVKRDYLRNRIRHDLIPLIEREYQPNFKEILLKTSRILRGEDDFLEKEGEKAFCLFVKKEEEGFSFDFSHYQSLHPALRWRILGRLLKLDPFNEKKRDLEINQRLIFERLDHPPPSFLTDLMEGVSLEKRYDRVMFRKKRDDTPPFFKVELKVPGQTFIKEIQMKVKAERYEKTENQEYPRASPHIALLDYKSLQFPLWMRNFRPGDRFQPLGMKGTQKLKEFFIDHKIPRIERLKVPLLISGEKIAWVVGHRISEEFKITPDTKEILRIEVL
ncbi:MAG: tRNA lysidine(34) synthetase TilS [Thermodesulfobacteriota bacterium]